MSHGSDGVEANSHGNAEQMDKSKDLASFGQIGNELQDGLAAASRRANEARNRERLVRHECDALAERVARLELERDRAVETRENANALSLRVEAERDAWIRSWNRLDAAISHHKKDKSAMFVDEVDEALYAARDRILKERANG